MTRQSLGWAGWGLESRFGTYGFTIESFGLRGLKGFRASASVPSTPVPERPASTDKCRKSPARNKKTVEFIVAASSHLRSSSHSH